MYKNIIELPAVGYNLNYNATGRVKIWQRNMISGRNQLILDKPNLIVTSGADLLARAITGGNNAAITHYYVAYSNNVTAPTPSVSTSSTATTVFSTTGGNGILKIPLAFPPTITNETNYNSNVPYFTVFISSGSTGVDTPGAFANGSKIYGLGLVAASTAGPDSLFSAIAVTPVTYDANHGLAITWGLTFRAV